MIEGATATLASSKPALLVEIERRHSSRPIEDVFQKIFDFGYSGFFMKNGKLADLTSFDAERHQSIESFGGSKELYINNFLFLHRAKLADGEYAALLKSRYLK